MTYSNSLFSAIYLLIFVSIRSLQADAIEDALLRDANKCLRYFPHFERDHNIPENLLKAISIVETKRWHNNSNAYVPWPWAVNSNGKSYYFNSKQEAISEVKKMFQNGQKSIDVGCMQINLYHHPKAFKNLEEAFEPSHNIKYAAGFLKNNFKKHNNWKKAIAAYHSENNQFGHPYAYKVISQWHNKNSNIQTTKKYLPQIHNNVSQRYDKYSEINQRRRRSSLLIKINNSDAIVSNNATMDLVNSLNHGRNIDNVNIID